MPSIQTFQIPGLTLNARIFGPPSGLPVLGMHGWLDNAATFDLIAPLLPQLRVVSIDFPGHGFSDFLPACATYNNIDRALQMFQLVDVLGWSEFSIIGHSLGGIVGQLMAAVAPERVKKVALIDVMGLLSRPGDAVVSRIQTYIQASKNPVQHAIYASLEEAARKRITTSVTGNLSLKGASVLASGGMREVEGGYSWTFDVRLQIPSAIVLTNEQASAILNNFTTDSVLITGNDGILHEYSMPDRKTKHLQNMRVVELEGGHHLHLDTPEPVAAVLAGFFNEG